MKFRIQLLFGKIVEMRKGNPLQQTRFASVRCKLHRHALERTTDINGQQAKTENERKRSEDGNSRANISFALALFGKIVEMRKGNPLQQTRFASVRCKLHRHALERTTDINGQQAQTENERKRSEDGNSRANISFALALARFVETRRTVLRDVLETLRQNDDKDRT